MTTVIGKNATPAWKAENPEFPAHPGLTLLTYTAAAGTPTADSLKMLASWAATAEQTGDLPAHA